MARTKRICIVCGNEYGGHDHKSAKKTCGHACQRIAQAQRDAQVGESAQRLVPATTGAIGEMLASADLLRRGYHVFRAVSPACPCDLLAYRDPQRIIRVEVRSATTTVDGSWRASLVQQPRDEGRQDVFALILPTGEIAYYPPDIII